MLGARQHLPQLSGCSSRLFQRTSETQRESPVLFLARGGETFAINRQVPLLPGQKSCTRSDSLALRVTGPSVSTPAYPEEVTRTPWFLTPELNCNLWTTPGCTQIPAHTDHRGNTCTSSLRIRAGPLHHLVTLLDARATFLLGALLSHGGVQSGLSSKNWKILELPGICQCLLASRGIRLATLISVLKNYV